MGDAAHALRRAWQIYRTRNGIRLLIVLVLAAAGVQFYTAGLPSGQFMGMYRMSDDPATPNLLANVYAIAYMACGLALPLEQPSEYLCVPDCLVYVRKPRDAAHFLRYLLMVAAYAFLYAGVQALVAWRLAPGPGVASGAACSALTLLVLLLLANLGYLLAGPGRGYLAPALLYAGLLSVNPAARWLAHGSVLSVPAWVPVLGGMAAALCAVDLHVFRHLEIR